MSRATFLAAMVISGLAAGVAHAAGWADYESAFPVFPCNDGWMGCRVDGDVHSPDLENDASGLPTPSSWRVSWFELAPTRAFSPFGGLSEYTGEAPPGMGGDAAADAGGEDPPPAVPSAADREAEEAARRAEEERRAAEEAQQRAAEEAEAAAAAAAEAQQEAQRQAEAARRAEEEAAQASAEEKARLQAEAEAARKAAAEAEAARKAAEEAEAKRQEEARLAAEAAAKKAEEERLAAEAAAKAEADRKAAEEAAAAAAAVADASEPAGEAPAAAAGDCSDIVKLEPMAMLGKLDGGQAAACEAALQSADKQTTKDKISRLLMTNAYSKGDKKEWERLVKRHLNEIDRSDPDLCYKYALNLNRKGPGAATGVIRWADVALENRMVWTGDTYVSRVYSLYKLKSGAAQKLWKKAEEVHASSPSDETQGKIDKHRNDTKVFAREWYEYAKTSGKDTTIPLQLCMSAAGTADYCEAG